MQLLVRVRWIGGEAAGSTTSRGLVSVPFGAWLRQCKPLAATDLSANFHNSLPQLARCETLAASESCRSLLRASSGPLSQEMSLVLSRPGAPQDHMRKEIWLLRWQDSPSASN